MMRCHAERSEASPSESKRLSPAPTNRGRSFGRVTYKKQNSASFESLFCFKANLSLVATRCNVAPVEYNIIYYLCTGRAITESQLSVGNFTATAIFLHVIPVTKRVFIFDLSSFFAGESDRPVCGINPG